MHQAFLEEGGASERGGAHGKTKAGETACPACRQAGRFRGAVLSSVALAKQEGDFRAKRDLGARAVSAKGMICGGCVAAAAWRDF